MPIRLTQVGVLDYDPTDVRLPPYQLEFQHHFPDKKACTHHLSGVRWPEGLECPSWWQVDHLQGFL